MLFTCNIIIMKNMNKIKLLVMISGGGTTLLNMLDIQNAGGLNADIVCVISSKSKCEENRPVLERCENDGIPIRYINPGKYASRQEFWGVQDETVNEFAPDLIALAGYLKLWRIPEKYLCKVMNIHPALLPKYGGKGFYGMRVHNAVLNAGEKESGCTVHFASNEYDSGPIILQKKVQIFSDDTADSLKKRVFTQECIAYPEAINLFAEGRLKIKGNINAGTVEIID